MVPDRPQRRILLAQPPQGKGLQPHLPRRAQLIQRGHRIQHPDLVAHVVVFVVVGKMRDSARRRPGARPHWHPTPPAIRPAPRCRRYPAPWPRRACPSGQRHGPVVAIIANGADQLLFGHHFEHALQVVFKPVLRRNGSGTARLLVLVVVHQQDAVGVAWPVGRTRCRPRPRSRSRRGADSWGASGCTTRRSASGSRACASSGRSSRSRLRPR